MKKQKKTRYDRERDRRRRRREQRSRLVGVATAAGVALDPAADRAAEPETHRTVSSAEILSGGRAVARQVAAPPTPEQAPEPSRIIAPSSSLRLRPTATPWLNRMVPHVLPPSWRERDDDGDRLGVTYTSTSGLSVRVSGGTRSDLCRWVYLDISRLDRDPSDGDVTEARDLVLGRSVPALQSVPADFTAVPRHHKLVVVNVDRPAFPPAIKPTDEYA